MLVKPGSDGYCHSPRIGDEPEMHADDLPEPGADGGLDGSAAPKRVVTGDRDNLPPRSRRWHPERVALSLDDERWHAHSLELGEAALCGVVCPAGWVHRKCQTENSDCAGIGRRSAGHPCAG